ncbi:hypothetical protein BDW69DRAFT_176544 [Aspergillus filifer]
MLLSPSLSSSMRAPFAGRPAAASWSSRISSAPRFACLGPSRVSASSSIWPVSVSSRPNSLSLPSPEDSISNPRWTPFPTPRCWLQ